MMSSRTQHDYSTFLLFVVVFIISCCVVPCATATEGGTGPRQRIRHRFAAVLEDNTSTPFPAETNTPTPSAVEKDRSTATQLLAKVDESLIDSTTTAAFLASIVSAVVGNPTAATSIFRTWSVLSALRNYHHRCTTPPVNASSSKRHHHDHHVLYRSSLPFFISPTSFGLSSSNGAAGTAEPQLDGQETAQACTMNLVLVGGGCLLHFVVLLVRQEMGNRRRNVHNGEEKKKSDEGVELSTDRYHSDDEPLRLERQRGDSESAAESDRAKTTKEKKWGNVLSAPGVQFPSLILAVVALPLFGPTVMAAVLTMRTTTDTRSRLEAGVVLLLSTCFLVYFLFLSFTDMFTSVYKFHNAGKQATADKLREKRVVKKKELRETKKRASRRMLRNAQKQQGNTRTAAAGVPLLQVGDSCGVNVEVEEVFTSSSDDNIDEKKREKKKERKPQQNEDDDGNDGRDSNDLLEEDHVPENKKKRAEKLRNTNGEIVYLDSRTTIQGTIDEDTNILTEIKTTTTLPVLSSIEEFFMGDGEWVDENGDTNNDGDAAGSRGGFTVKYSLLLGVYGVRLQPFWMPKPWMAFFDLFTTVIVAVMDGWGEGETTPRSVCMQPLLACLFVVLLAYFVLLVILRPYSSGFNVVFNSVCAFLQMLSALFVLVSVAQGGNQQLATNAFWAAIFVLCLHVVKALMDVMFLLWRHVLREKCSKNKASVVVEERHEDLNAKRRKLEQMEKLANSFRDAPFEYRPVRPSPPQHGRVNREQRSSSARRLPSNSDACESEELLPLGELMHTSKPLRQSMVYDHTSRRLNARARGQTATAEQVIKKLTRTDESEDDVEFVNAAHQSSTLLTRRVQKDSWALRRGLGLYDSTDPDWEVDGVGPPAHRVKPTLHLEAGTTSGGEVDEPQQYSLRNRTTRPIINHRLQRTKDVLTANALQQELQATDKSTKHQHQRTRDINLRNELSKKIKYLSWLEYEYGLKRAERLELRELQAEYDLLSRRADENERLSREPHYRKLLPEQDAEDDTDDEQQLEKRSGLKQLRETQQRQRPSGRSLDRAFNEEDEDDGAIAMRLKMELDGGLVPLRRSEHRNEAKWAVRDASSGHDYKSKLSRKDEIRFAAATVTATLHDVTEALTLSRGVCIRDHTSSSWSPPARVAEEEVDDEGSPPNEFQRRLARLSSRDREEEDHAEALELLPSLNATNTSSRSATLARRSYSPPPVVRSSSSVRPPQLRSSQSSHSPRQDDDDGGNGLLAKMQRLKRTSTYLDVMQEKAIEHREMVSLGIISEQHPFHNAMWLPEVEKQQQQQPYFEIDTEDDELPPAFFFPPGDEQHLDHPAMRNPLVRTRASPNAPGTVLRKAVNQQWSSVDAKAARARDDHTTHTNSTKPDKTARHRRRHRRRNSSSSSMSSTEQEQLRDDDALLRAKLKLLL